MLRKSTNVIGSGFIAKNFLKKEKYLLKKDVCIYASGVSNSVSSTISQYKKEIIKLKHFKKKMEKKNIIIYFSTCSIYDPFRKNKSYIKHKLFMERMLKKEFKRFIIIRLPEVVGKSSNKYTLVNFLSDKIKKSDKFKLWPNASRNLIDIKDVVHIVLKIVQSNKFTNKTINIFNPKMCNVLQIVECFERIYKKKGNYTLINNQKRKWKIKYSKINKKNINFNYRFKQNYLYRILNNYYTK